MASGVKIGTSDLTNFLAMMNHQLFGQGNDFRRTRLQRRNIEYELAQAIIQVASKKPFFDPLVEAPVRRGNDPHVNGFGTRIANTIDSPILEHPQEFRWEIQGQFADFIEQQRAAVGNVEMAWLVAGSARKCAALVPEHFAFEHGLRHVRAIDRHEFTVRSCGRCVNRPRQDFFAYAGIAQNEHARSGCGFWAISRTSACSAFMAASRMIGTRANPSAPLKAASVSHRALLRIVVTDPNEMRSPHFGTKYLGHYIVALVASSWNPLLGPLCE
jgi:hypothetical protein